VRTAYRITGAADGINEVGLHWQVVKLCPSIEQSNLCRSECAPSQSRNSIGKATVAECEEEPKMNRRTLQRDLKLLVEKGLVREIGTGPTDPT